MMQMRLRLTVVVLAAGIALVAAVPARAQQPAALTINQLEAGRYPDLRAVVTVLDGNGVPVPNLGAPQFHAFQGEAPLAIGSVQRAQDASLPLSVVVAIDVSGSMAGDALVQAKQAATEFVRQLGPNDLAAIIIFNQQVSTAVPFTNDQARLTNGFATLQAGGGTALYAAVQASAFAGRSATSPRSAVVLLTDGQNDTTESDATADGSIAVAKGAGVPVFTVGFGDQPDTQYLQRLSAETAGEYRPATPENVSAVYGAIATLLRSQYVLSVKATGPADGGDAQLRLVADVAGVPVEATAGYRRGAAPVPPTQPPQPTPVPVTTIKQGDGSNAALIVFAAIVGAVVAGGGAYLAYSWLRRRRVLTRQLAVTASNPMQAAAQPLPKQAGVAAAARSGVEAGTGRLVEKTPEGDRVHLLGAGPVVIGSARRLCTIILPEGPDVAPEQVRIWLRDGKYLLHHAGGRRRRTLVNGREADWVRLEAGDELQFGRHRFVFEDAQG